MLFFALNEMDAFQKQKGSVMMESCCRRKTNQPNRMKNVNTFRLTHWMRKKKLFFFSQLVPFLYMLFKLQNFDTMEHTSHTNTNFSIRDTEEKKSEHRSRSIEVLFTSIWHFKISHACKIILCLFDSHNWLYSFGYVRICKLIQFKSTHEI